MEVDVIALRRTAGVRMVGVPWTQLVENLKACSIPYVLPPHDGVRFYSPTDASAEEKGADVSLRVGDVLIVEVQSLAT